MIRLLLMGIVLTACVKRPVEPGEPSTGSETHWLQSCEADGPDCSCVCGVCTAVCDGDDACERADVEARCAAPRSPELDALCGVAPAGEGLCVAACEGDGSCGDGLACREGVCVAVEAADVSDLFEVPGRPRVDYLFVVDDSGSMCEEQAALSRAFQRVAEMLWTDHDFRLAVVSTDGQGASYPHGAFLRRPAEPVPSLNCRDENGDAAVPDTEDCAELVAGDLLPTILTREAADSADLLARQFRCLVTLGTGGDGFEKGLESMRQALSCDGPNSDLFAGCCDGGQYRPEACAAPEFLRPDADLVVVFLTDEDDCSDGPDAPVSRAENSNCEWQRDALVPVAEYAGFLDALKPAPRRQIGVAPIVGRRLYTGDGDVVHFEPGVASEACQAADLDVDACCPDGLCSGTIQPSCSSDAGFAFAGHRYIELAAGYPGCDPESGCSVCTDDLAEPLLSAMQDYVFVRPAYCLERRPVCAVVDGAAVRACEGDEADDPANLLLRVEVWCEGVRCETPVERRALAADEWRLVDDPGCAAGVRLAVVDPYPRGTTVQARYRATVD